MTRTRARLACANDGTASCRHPHRRPLPRRRRGPDRRDARAAGMGDRREARTAGGGATRRGRDTRALDRHGSRLQAIRGRLATVRPGGGEQLLPPSEGPVLRRTLRRAGAQAGARVPSGRDVGRRTAVARHASTRAIHRDAHAGVRPGPRRTGHARAAAPAAADRGRDTARPPVRARRAAGHGCRARRCARPPRRPRRGAGHADGNAGRANVVRLRSIAQERRARPAFRRRSRALHPARRGHRQVDAAHPRALRRARCG